MLGLDGRTPDWVSLAIFVVTIITIQSIAEFANSYTDRDEDHLYGPTNRLVTGELNAQTARLVLIFQNIRAASRLIALLVITLNDILIAVLAIGWFFGLAYSVLPLRLKETPYAPFDHALAFAL